MAPAAGCPSARRLLGRSPWRPAAPMVRIHLGSRVVKPKAQVSRSLSGRPVVRITAPASWLDAPPSLEELARLVCCAQDVWRAEALTQLLLGALTVLSIAAGHAPGSLGDTVAAIATLLGAVIAMLAGFIYARITLEWGAPRQCHVMASSVASTLHAGYYTSLARLVKSILQEALSCNSRACKTTLAGPLGRYTIETLRRARRIVIRAKPAAA